MDHYMWNYMFFMAYLNWKNKKDYTGIESFVDEQQQKNEYNWYFSKL